MIEATENTYWSENDCAMRVTGNNLAYVSIQMRHINVPRWFIGIKTLHLHTYV